MTDYVGFIVTAAIFAVIIGVQYFLLKLDGRAPTESKEEDDAATACPFCRADMVDIISKAARGSRHPEVIVDCPSCELKAQWDISGFPPILLKKISRPAAQQSGDGENDREYQKAE